MLTNVMKAQVCSVVISYVCMLVDVDLILMVAFIQTLTN